MIVLDTNVVSEPLKPRPDPKVLAWLDRQPEGSLFLATTSLAELLLGVELLPAGRRKKGLARMLTGAIADLFESRILSFDERAARNYAHIVAEARTAGKAVSVFDAQIAAIAAAHAFAVATRDAAAFETAGVPVVNPWADPVA